MATYSSLATTTTYYLYGGSQSPSASDYWDTSNEIPGWLKDACAWVYSVLPWSLLVRYHARTLEIAGTSTPDNDYEDDVSSVVLIIGDEEKIGPVLSVERKDVAFDADDQNVGRWVPCRHVTAKEIAHMKRNPAYLPTNRDPVWYWDFASIATGTHITRFIHILPVLVSATLYYGNYAKVRYIERPDRGASAPEIPSMYHDLLPIFAAAMGRMKEGKEDVAQELLRQFKTSVFDVTRRLRR